MIYKDLKPILDNAMSLLMNHEQHEEPDWIKDYENLCRQYEVIGKVVENDRR